MSMEESSVEKSFKDFINNPELLYELSKAIGNSLPPSVNFSLVIFPAGVSEANKDDITAVSSVDNKRLLEVLLLLVKTFFERKEVKL